MIALSKLREKLELPADDDGRDLLDALVGLWEDETKRLWTRRVAHVETIRVNQAKRIYSLFLQLWPIETVTKVEERALSDSTWTELTADQYLLTDPNRNRLERVGTCWPALVRVTYTGGYTGEPTAGAVPPQNKTPQDIQEALLVQAKFMRERNVPGRVITQSQNFEGGAGVFLKPGLHPEFSRLAASKARKV